MTNRKKTSNLAAMRLGRKIRVLRRKRGVSQQQVADFVGLSKMAISSWERGLNVPSALQLMQLAQYFSVPTDEFNSLSA